MRYKELPSSEGRQQRHQLPVKMLLTLGEGRFLPWRRRAGCGAVGGEGCGGRVPRRDDNHRGFSFVRYYNIV